MNFIRFALSSIFKSKIFSLKKIVFNYQWACEMVEGYEEFIKDREREEM